MMASPPWYCFSATDDDPNNFIARTTKLRGLAGRHERNVNDEMLGPMRDVMMNPLHFQCHCRTVHPLAECHDLVMAEVPLSYAEIDFIRQ
jgi:hypothetical protein